MMISLFTLAKTPQINPTTLKTAERQATPLVIDSGRSITEVGEFPSGTVEHRGSGRLKEDVFTKLP